MGAHTEYGGYIIDWRKVRNYAVPDLKEFKVRTSLVNGKALLTLIIKLTPFVTNEMEPTSRQRYDENDVAYIPKRVDAMDYLKTWQRQNPQEYDQILKFKETSRQEIVNAEARRKELAVLDRQYHEELKQTRGEEPRLQGKKRETVSTKMDNATQIDPVSAP